MKKWKRSARIVDMTRQLIQQPHCLIPLSTFAERYDTAKSSISEDLTIIHEVMHATGQGGLETLAGAAGGVRFIPGMDRETAEKVMRTLCRELSNPDRILPGGFLYMSDLLGQPGLLRDIGQIWASVFAKKQVDVVVTVETKGIPLALAAAAHLGVPVAIVRQGNRVTEGSVVTVNTVSGSSKRIRTLSLSRRSLKEGSRVLIIDDFMKAGGTIRGMIDLLSEFRADVVGAGVLVESAVQERLVENVVSLAKITAIDEKQRTVDVRLGNLFEKGKGWEIE
jgi:purine operon repressor